MPQRWLNYERSHAKHPPPPPDERMPLVKRGRGMADFSPEELAVLHAKLLHWTATGAGREATYTHYYQE